MSGWYKQIKIAQGSAYDFENNVSSSDITPEMINDLRFETAKEGEDTTRYLMSGKEVVGETTVMHDQMFERNMKRIFKNIISPDDKVLRLRGIYLAKQLRDRGLGKKLFMDIFSQFSDYWLGNSELGYGGTDPAAIYAIESLKPRINVHWFNGKGGVWVAKLDEDNADSKTPKKYHGNGFFTNMGYFKGGVTSVMAYDTKDAIERFIKDGFVPVYITISNEDGAVLDLNDADSRKIYDAGYELMETRDSAKKESILKSIREALIGMV